MITKLAKRRDESEDEDQKVKMITRLTKTRSQD